MRERKAGSGRVRAALRNEGAALFRSNLQSAESAREGGGTHLLESTRALPPPSRWMKTRTSSARGRCYARARIRDVLRGETLARARAQRTRKETRGRSTSSQRTRTFTRDARNTHLASRAAVATLNASRTPVAFGRRCRRRAAEPPNSPHPTRARALALDRGTLLNSRPCSIWTWFSHGENI